jgi:membrane-associated phospholipid phosphatase
MYLVKHRYLKIDIFLLITILIFAIVKIMNLDVLLFRYINQISLYTGPIVWANVTILGDTLIALVIILPFIYKKPNVFWPILFAGIIALLVSHGIKNLLVVPRPPAIMDPQSFEIIGPAYRQRSFPSGHATTVFTFATVILSYKRSKKYKIYILSLALLIGVSRIIVGIHWPSDVLAGIVLGYLSGYSGLCIYLQWYRQWPKVKKYIIRFITVVAVVILIFFHDTGYEQVKLLQTLISLAAILQMLLQTYLIDRIKNS